MKKIFITFFILIIPFIISCSDDTDGQDLTGVVDPTDFDIPDWTTETHSNDADLDYTEVYDNDNTVRRLDIV